MSNPVTNRIQNILFEQGWKWGWNSPHTPSEDEIESSVRGLITHLRGSEGPVVSGGILLNDTYDFENEIEVYVQVGVFNKRTGQLTNVPMIGELD